MDDTVQIHPLAHMPHGRTWTWHGTDLLVIEATLDDTGRQTAIDEAFADLRDRALGRTVAA